MTSHQPTPLSAATLLRFNANALKRIARVWVGKEATKMNKEACAQAIARALADPPAVRAMVERLSPFERAGLGLLKLHGHTAPTDVLALELLMLGLPFQERASGYRYYHQENHYEALNHLLNKGLVWRWEHDVRYGYHSEPIIDQYHYSPMLFAEQRLLEHIAVTPPAALDLAPVASVEPQWTTRPAEVVLRFVSFAETLRKLGRIEYTRQGRVSKPFLARLTRALGWGATQTQDPLTPLADAPLFFLQLFAAAGFLRPLPNEATLGIALDVVALFELPYAEQARRWVRAYRALTGWIEFMPGSVRLYGEDSTALRKFRGLRAALLLALGALPEPTAWYRLSDLADELYRQLGERFTLGYFHSFYPPYGVSPEQAQQKHREWQDQLQASWRQNEQQWMAHAVTGPLFHLGLVELAAAPDTKGTQPALFRLSALGREATYDIFRTALATRAAAAAEQHTAEASRCWVVQPNFDIIVYLDRASATRLTFVERIAERRPSHGATTLYHLTRDTVYAALEAGIEPDTLVETLAQGAEYPLPDNVRRTLEDWAARRERLTVYPQVNLVEFANAQARDAALASKRVQGVLVGERFVMLASPGGRGKMVLHLRRTIDYHTAPARCVRIAEDGTVQLSRPLADLLVQGELACWAEPATADGSRWRLTRTSIQRAVNAGWTAERILDSLSKRTQHGIPPLVSVSIRAWAGTQTLPTTTALASELILQIMSDEVATALASSALFQPYFRGRLGPKTFLVRPETAHELDKKLQAYGLSVGSDLLFADPQALLAADHA
jgi:hypothetical protein